MMRVAVPLLTFGLSLVASLALAEDVATTSGMASSSTGIAFNTSFSLNQPLTGADRAAKQAEEDSYRRDLYSRSIKECTFLLESIASSCVITSVNISTQINSNPGQPDYLYVSSNISMQVDLK